MKYYKKKLFFPQVDKNDNVIDKVERWSAHKKNVLHRGFTVILYYQDKIILQHRKHPAFDKYYDLTFSSHQIYKNKILQTNSEAIFESLEREWNIEENGLIKKLKYLGKFYYQAKDPNSIFSEHEIDYIYSAELKTKPDPNLEFAYGYKLIAKSPNLKSQISNYQIAPWVKKIIDNNFV